jgi:membrane-associated phospholipid phosphatase
MSDETIRGESRRASAAGTLSPLAERWLLFAAAFAVYTMYLVSGRLIFGRTAKTLATPIDDAIPFAASWEWAYVFIYAAVFLPLLQIRDLRVLRRAVLGFAVCQIVANILFFAFPVRMVRPEHLIEPGRSLVEWGLALNYSLDPPVNCFPSLHVANAFYAALVCWSLDRAVGRGMIAAAVLIAVSTLFTKQHYVADALAGLFLGFACWRRFFAGQIPDDVPREALVYPRRRLLAVPIAFGLAVAVCWYAYRAGWRYTWPTPYGGN